MNRAEVAARLEAAARERGLAWPPGSAERLTRYLAAVVRLSKDVNLTGAETLPEAVEVLGVPSLALGRAWPARRPAPRLVVDLGSGNGMPGVVAALAWPAARVLLVERRAKKARAIEECLREAEILNAGALPIDGRELLKAHPNARRGVDLVLARGVGELAEVTKIAAPWLAPGGRLVQWKGANLEAAERQGGEREAQRAGLVLMNDELFDPPQPGPGRLVIYGRTA